jgi:hypothetical protein
LGGRGRRIKSSKLVWATWKDLVSKTEKQGKKNKKQKKF